MADTLTTEKLPARTKVLYGVADFGATTRCRAALQWVGGTSRCLPIWPISESSTSELERRSVKHLLGQ
jgi:hypothetical protein